MTNDEMTNDETELVVNRELGTPISTLRPRLIRLCQGFYVGVINRRAYIRGNYVINGKGKVLRNKRE